MAAVWREMTVAHVREPAGVEYVEVTFLESPRFYRLPKTHPRFAAILDALREAAAKARPCNVQVSSLDSDVIEDIRES